MDFEEGQFTIEPLPEGGVRYRLPDRGLIRFAGIPLILFGLFFSGFAVFWIAGALATTQHASTPMVVRYLFPLFGLPFVLAGLVPVGLGLMLLMGRSAVELTRDEIRSVDLLWGMSWRSRMALAKVRRLEVRDQMAASRHRHSRDQQESGFPCICVVPDSGKPVFLAKGYSLDVLTSLAQQLQSDLASYAPMRLVDDAPSPPLEPAAVAAVDVVQVRDGVLDGALNPERLPVRPVSTILLHELNATGFTLTAPARGFFKGSHGLGCFSLVWLGFMLFFTSVASGIVVTGNVHSTGTPLIVIAFIGLFWVIGLAMATYARYLGQQASILDVVGDTLLITTKGWGEAKQYEWRRDQLRSIRVEPSGMEVNDVPVMQLTIEPLEGKKLSLLKNCSTEEQVWVAAMLREALGVPA